MSHIVNKVTINEFKRNTPIESHYAKTKDHKLMNQKVLDYFKEYATSLTSKGECDPRFLYLTITFNENILRSLKPHYRSVFIQRVYEQLWWRMHSKLNIKRPTTTKTHQHLLMRQYQVIEDVNRYGNKTLEHLHIICAVHPKFHNKMTRLYWESVADLPNSFTFDEESKEFDYQQCVDEFHIEEISIPVETRQNWTDLVNTIDYTNKSLSKIEQGRLVTGEIFNCFQPRNPFILKTISVSDPSLNTEDDSVVLTY